MGSTCTTRERDEEVIEKCAKNSALVKERRKKARAPRKRCAITRILKKVTKLKYIFQTLGGAQAEEKKLRFVSNNNNTYKKSF